MEAGGELELRAALLAIAADLAPTLASEIVAVAAARRRVLAQTVRSGIDLPGFDNAAMDGYALRRADAEQPLHEVGVALAGHPYEDTVPPHACVRIMTGAAVPAGADLVVMREDTRIEADRVVLTCVPAAGANIRRRGEHIARGTEVLVSGQRLRSADVGLLAGIGQERIAVRPRLRVGVLSTGDELADAPAKLSAGGSYDANRPLLAAALAALGFDVRDLGICADRPAAFDAAIERARADTLDALVISGGAALGDADVVRRSGSVRFVPIAIRPGRGIAVGMIGGSPSCLLLGLPGNVVAAFVQFHLVARPILLHLAGAPLAPTRQVTFKLARDLEVRGGRIDYLRARWVDDAALGAALEPLAEQSSSALHGVTQADALLAAGPQRSYRRGDAIGAVLLDALD